ncbi:hypothetical protein JHK82_050125 [Glycine max]|nr:hypothetical protein JHK82_050125 [Glycine max]
METFQKGFIVHCEKKFYVPQENIPTNKWFRPGNEGSNSHFKEFEVSSLALRRGGTTKGSRKGYYDYQNPPWVIRNMSKTQWRWHHRMRKYAILAVQHKNVARPSIFDKISEGPPPRFEKKISIKDQKDSLEAICGRSNYGFHFSWGVHNLDSFFLHHKLMKIVQGSNSFGGHAKQE